MSQASTQNARLALDTVHTQDIPVDNRLFSDWPYADVANMREAKVLLSRAENLIAEQQQRILQLESLALTDELTGLLNRRGLMLELRRELSAASRHPEARGILILCDLNGFKKINDKHGHNAGDAYLQEVAKVLSEEVRPSDVVARIGGDEFAILLTRVDFDSGSARLLKLERAFHTRALTWGARLLPLKACFGATAYNGDDTPEALLAAADVRLYAQKAQQK